MSDSGLTSAISALYQASAAGEDWHAAGRDIFRLIGVESGSLRMWQSDGRFVNILQPSQPLEDRYGQHFAQRDPIRAAARQTIPLPDWGTAIRSGEELVEGKSFLRSEFYQEFAKPLGRNQLLLGTLPDRDGTLILLFRERTPFTAPDKAVLAQLLPHLHRAIQLRQRLHGIELRARLGVSAFEALPGGAIVLDPDSHVMYLNTRAEHILSVEASPIVLRLSSRSPGGRAQLVLRNRHLAPRLQALVADAARGGSGGALRLDTHTGIDGSLCQLALLVSPSPQQPAMDPAQPEALAPVLVLMTELSRPRLPSISMLSDLFGLSTAEGAVALALLGGQTAESVARERNVSLDTIRSQIRTVLRKSNAANLRDFERIGALLASLTQG